MYTAAARTSPVSGILRAGCFGLKDRCLLGKVGAVFGLENVNFFLNYYNFEIRGPLSKNMRIAITGFY